MEFAGLFDHRCAIWKPEPSLPSHPGLRPRRRGSQQRQRFLEPAAISGSRPMHRIKFSYIWYGYDFPAFSQGSFSAGVDSGFRDLYVNYTPSPAARAGVRSHVGPGRIGLLAWMALAKAVATGSPRPPARRIRSYVSGPVFTSAPSGAKEGIGVVPHELVGGVGAVFSRAAATMSGIENVPAGVGRAVFAIRPAGKHVRCLGCRQSGRRQQRGEHQLFEFRPPRRAPDPLLSLHRES